MDCPCVGGIVIALCCHQRCEWKNFFGRDILESFGFGAADFHILTRMASWAVCGKRANKLQAVSDNPNKDNVIIESKTSENEISEPNTFATEGTFEQSGLAAVDMPTSDNVTKNYVPHPKEQIGLKCKQLLDLVRVHKLRQCRFDSRLVYYVDRTVSLENVLLIAIPKS